MDQFFEELADKTISLGTHEGWYQIHDETGIFGQDAGLIVITAQPFQLTTIVAAAYVALRYTVSVETDEPRFSKQLLVFPSGRTAENWRLEILKSIQSHMKAGGADEFSIRLVPLTCVTRSMVSFSGDQLILELSQLPPQSACILIHPELYRFPLEDEPSAPGVQKSLAAENSRHLSALIGMLAATAKETNSLMVLFAEQSRIDIDALASPDDISFIVFSTEASARSAPKFHLEPLLNAFRKGGWPAVKAHLEFSPYHEQQIAFALAEAFSAEQNLPLTWAVMEPFVTQADEWTVGSQIGMAAAAQAAGNWDASCKLLAKALKEEIQTPEELHWALTVAYSLNDETMVGQILEAMQLRHPESNLTRRGEFLQLFQQRDFENALRVAEGLNLPVETAHCRAFLSDPIDADKFLLEMERIGDLEHGLISCADEAMYRNMPLSAIQWAGHIPEDHAMYERAFRIRIAAIRMGMRDDNNNPFIEELELVMRIVARHPTKIRFRGYLERLLEDQIEEPLVKLALSTILVVAVGRQSTRDDLSIEASASFLKSRDLSRGIQDEAQIGEFMKAAFKSLANTPETGFLMGRGELSPDLLAMVGPKLIQWLAEGALEWANDEVTAEQASVFIHIVCLCCKAVDEPVLDLSLIHCIIERMATHGESQDSRNLAETALQFLPELQPSHRDWRVSQGWASLAEACLRSSNRLAALRYLCLSFLAHEDAVIGIELLRRRYRMAARILRDLGITPMALLCVAVERNLLTKANALEEQELPLEVFEMQVSLTRPEGDQEEHLLQLLDRSQELLGKGIKSELYPLIAIQANILRRLPSEKCPAGIVENFQRRVSELPSRMGEMLKSTANPEPSREDIVALIRGLPDAQDHDYLAYQIHQALPALSNALEHAVATGDTELFLVTSGAFAQPSLGVRIAQGKGEVIHDGTPSLLRTTTLEGLKSATFTPIPRYSFAPLAEITISQLQSCIGKDETVLVMAGEPGTQPSSIMVTSSAVTAPRLVAEWSVESFQRWGARFKDELKWGKPNSYIPGIDSLLPPIRKVTEFFDGLALNLDALPKHLTIMPPSHLFGFTWQLLPYETGFLTECTSLAVAPSAQWLVAARTSPWVGKQERSVWIGSKETTDGTLIALKSMVEEGLKSNGFVISDDAGPYGFAGCELAVIGAHGMTGFDDYFRTVSDRVNYFSPSEIANMLTGCGCVVLAVCSGGRSDGQAGTAETLGLVTSLFRAGVRCVIAPPWPLDIEVVQHWLHAFLTSMDGGHSVGVSAAAARDAVRLKIDHPCAWGQLHIYGDQNFSVASRS
jgi:hypothetical protein